MGKPRRPGAARLSPGMDTPGPSKIPPAWAGPFPAGQTTLPGHSVSLTAGAGSVPVGVIGLCGYGGCLPVRKGALRRAFPWPPPGVSAATGALILIWADAWPAPFGPAARSCRGRGQRPCSGGAVFLLSVEIPPSSGDVVIRVEALELGYEDRQVPRGPEFAR